MPLDEPKHIFCIIVGLLSFVYGVLPLLSIFGVIKSLPGFLLLGSSAMIWVTAILGLLLIGMTFYCQEDATMWIFVLFGLIIFALPLLSLLKGFGVIGFSVPLSGMVLDIMVTVSGVGLIVDAFGSR